jgi:hypothetical protein
MKKKKETVKSSAKKPIDKDSYALLKLALENLLGKISELRWLR